MTETIGAINEFLFGKEPTQRELLRKNKRSIAASIREIERERMRMAAEERTSTTRIKRLGESGQEEAARLEAKNVVRTRAYMARFAKMKMQLEIVQVKMDGMKTSEAMTRAMRSVTTIMKTMNAQMGPSEMMSLMTEFAKQSGESERTENVMEDVLDDVTGGEEDSEEEASELVAKVLEEIGLCLSEDMPGSVTLLMPQSKKVVPTPPTEVESEQDIDGAFRYPGPAIANVLPGSESEQELGSESEASVPPDEQMQNLLIRMAKLRPN